MPFTPFHVGPAPALKAVSGRYFRVPVFGIAQIAMDIEPLIGILHDANVRLRRSPSRQSVPGPST